MILLSALLVLALLLTGCSGTDWKRVVGCALAGGATGNPNACRQGGTYQAGNQMPVSPVGEATKECYSDIECGVGNKCVKARGDINITGTCVTPSNNFGTPIIDTSTPRSQPRNVAGCSFDTDCPIGFSCMKRDFQIYGICVK